MTVRRQNCFLCLFLVAIASLSLIRHSIATQTTSNNTSFEVSDTHALQKIMDQIKGLRLKNDLSPQRIVLSDGIFRFSEILKITHEHSGDGLVIAAKTSGKAILCGSVPLAPPTRQGLFWDFPVEGLVDADSVPRCLTINGNLSRPARHPNVGFLRIEKSLPDRRSGFIVPAGGLPDGFSSNPESADLIFLHDWSTSRLPISGYNGTDRILKTVGPIGCEAPHYAIDHYEPHPRFLLEGHSSFADQELEWYYDRRKNAICVFSSTETPPIVELPTIETLLSIEGNADGLLSNVRIEGVVFTGTSFPMPPGGMADAQATMSEPRGKDGSRTTRNRPFLSSAVRVKGANRVTFDNCIFENLGNTALEIGSRCNDCLASNSVFRNIGGNAINLGEDNSRNEKGKAWFQSVPEQVPSRNIVRSNEINNIGRMMFGGVGIWLGLNQSAQVIDNHVSDLPYTGISMGFIWSPIPSPAGNNLIKGNRVERVMRTLSDGGAIYTLGNQPGSVIEDNIIDGVAHAAGRAESNGMFFDEGTTGLLIRNNTIKSVAQSPLRFHRAGVNHVEKNQWELATTNTPPVKYNNTKTDNVLLSDNQVLEKPTRIYFIGNSLTWDALPSYFGETTSWHVDCGKNLRYIYQHAAKPCVESSKLWPEAMRAGHLDFVFVQPFYGTTLEDDAQVISEWMQMQPKATFVIHTGWAPHDKVRMERESKSDGNEMTHCHEYFEKLRSQLQSELKDRTILITACSDLINAIDADVTAKRSPLSKLADLYRDEIHMNEAAGRWLIHNSIRQTLGLPIRSDGFPPISPEIRDYLTLKIQSQ